MSNINSPEKAQKPHIFVKRFDYHSGVIEYLHTHREGQLVYALSGVIKIITTSGIWILPSNTGLWIPSNEPHELHMVGEVSMCPVYITPEAIPSSLKTFCLIKISPLLKELILEMLCCTHSSLLSLLRPLLLKLLSEPEHIHGCCLPLPKDPKIRKLCEYLLEHPSNTTSIDIWADHLGVSPRTLIRHFKQQTGMSFTQWKVQVRLSEAIKQLSNGVKINQISSELGYTSPNAFGLMFRKVMGVSPSQYID